LCFSFYIKTSSTFSFYLSSSFILAFSLFYRFNIPRPYYHPFTLFSLYLIYRNERAKRVVSYLDNSYYILTLFNSTLAFNVSFYIYKKLSTTFTTLKQGVKADIYIKGFSTTKI